MNRKGRCYPNGLNDPGRLELARPGPPVALMGGVKSLLVFVSVAAVGAYVAFQQLPSGEARATPASPHEGMVVSITLDGQNLPLAALRTVLSSHPGDQLDKEVLEKDRAAMSEALVARGFLAATVKPAVITWSDDAAYISYDITQGPMFRIGQVLVTGATDKDAVITISSGDDAIASRIESARQTLADNLARRGKRHDVAIASSLDRAHGVVDITLATR